MSRIAEKTLLTEIDVNDPPINICLIDDGLLEVVDDIKAFMKENNIVQVNLGGIRFIYGEEEN